MNHEFTDERYLHTGTTALPATASWTADMVRKSQAAHGVSVVAVAEEAPGSWTVKRSRLNRRITANTPMSFSGPAAGHRLVRTAADPAGRSPIGTFNNCSHGVTPWDTYLTCEENFNGYFSVVGGHVHRRAAGADQLATGWAGTATTGPLHDPRFVVTPENPNEPNRCGWVVEIDPFDP